MSLIRKIVIPSLFVASFFVLGVWQDQLSNESVAQSGRSVPRFEVDPFWPQPLPNHWVMGNTIGIDIDEEITFLSFIATLTMFSIPRNCY